MYCDFFGFAERPFDLTPDPKFLYLSSGHREMLATLLYGIRERRGFIVCVGEVGTGKTTLLNTVLGRLSEKTQVAFIFNTNVDFDEMLTMALFELGLVKPEEVLPKVEMIRRLNDFAIRQMASGGNVVLMVDEAQNLDRSAMENLRLLSNLETRKHKLIQIVLSGQPELDVKLSQPELRQLAQRISLKRYITPLAEKETYEYIQHRLSIAEYSGRALFSHQAKKMVWEYSGGVPRKINILCDNALLTAYALRQKWIEVKAIQEAIKDLTSSPFAPAAAAEAAIAAEPPPSRHPRAVPVDARNVMQRGDQADRVQVAVEQPRPDPGAGQRVKEPVRLVQPASRGKTSYLRFARAASLVGVACIILLAGFLLGRSRLDLQGIGPLPVGSPTGAEIPIQQTPSNHSPAQEPESGPVQTSVVGNGSSAAKKPELRPIGTYVVKKGDNLSEIIFETHGRYNRDLLRAFLRQNPGLQDPHRIGVGQVITLPETK